MKYFKTIPLILALTAAFSCGGRGPATVSSEHREEVDSQFPVSEEGTETETGTDMDTGFSLPPSPTALLLDSMGYVNIKDIDASIAVEIVYATPDNFMGEILYGDLREAYLLPEAARKLADAQKLLKKERPDLSLIVYDAARPMSVQRKMWDVAVRTGRQYYVANPAKGGGLHNYGAAVDVSLVDASGVPLSMGTAYDHLGPEANIDREGELVRAGVITPEEFQNRLLLRGVMRAAGWSTVTSEWWHFNHCGREEARRRYPVIDF